MRKDFVQALSGAAAALLLCTAVPATAQCLPGYCPFSISGKKGPFLQKQVTVAELAKADREVLASAAEGQGLASVSINRGDAAGTGISMPQTEAALSAMLDKIRAGWPYRMPPPIRVRILGTTRYSPTARPDNVITVPLGLLTTAKTDDEIAWVLAHEFSHIALGHFSREVQQRRLKGGVDKIVACSRVGLTLTQTRVRGSGDNVNLYMAEDKGIQGISASVLSRSETIGEILDAYNQSLSRGQEDEADAAGVDLAVKAAYANDGYGDALTAVDEEDKRAGTILAKLQSGLTEYAKASVGQSTAKIASGGNWADVGTDWLKGMARNGLQILGDKTLAYIKQSHRPAKERREGLGKYLDTAYASAAPVETQDSWLTAVRSTTEFRNARDAVVARDTAKAELDALVPVDPKDLAAVAQRDAGIQRAHAAMKPVIGTRNAQIPLFANVIARLHDVGGRYDEADRVYDQADRFTGVISAPPPPPAPARRGQTRGAAPPPVKAVVEPPVVGDKYLLQSLNGFGEHVDFLVRRAKYAKALQVIDLAKARFGDDERFLPNLIAIYAQTNRKDLLVQTIARCSQNQQSAMKDECDAAMLNPQQQAKLAMLPPADQAELMEKIRYATTNARTTSTCGILGATKLSAALD